jgi:hypothetical protein
MGHGYEMFDIEDLLDINPYNRIFLSIMYSAQSPSLGLASRRAF